VYSDGAARPVTATEPAWNQSRSEDQSVTAERNDDERARSLAEIERDYPGWHAWPGVLAGVVYARRPRSSPPLVVRAITPSDLRHAIEAAETERGLR
jgi:hypothetical protein